MDVLKAWKLQRGKGTYVYDDGELHFKAVENLILSISKMNDSIKGVCARSIVNYNNNLIGDYFTEYENAIIPKEPVFLLVVLNIEEIPRDIFSIIINSNPHKYLFCTANTDDLNRYHLQVAPIIKFEVTTKRMGITSSQRNIYNVGLDLTSEDQITYDKYTEIMNDIFSFFDGDFETINHCYAGDQTNNITADIFRRRFAFEKGWTDTLDTSIDYYKEVDKHFNPNSIYEKAKQYMEMMAKRNHFVDEHSDKIKFAVKLLMYYNDKRFVVVCKNNEMADMLQRALYATNSVYHSRAIHVGLESTNFMDDEGNIILYKSGARKGQPREFGAKFQTDSYVDWFNRKLLKSIIITNAPQKDISLEAVDGIVYLSPKCLKYEELQSRINIKLNGNTNLVNVYISGTTDESKLRSNLSGGKHDPRYYNKGDISKLSFD